MAFYLVKTKTSQCWGHEEYVNQVSLTYDEENVEKNRGTQKKFYVWGGGIFFLEFFGKNQKVMMVGA